jgi:type I restriction enzyme, R subunit
MSAESANFEFLRSQDIQLVRLGALAERYFSDDPNTCVMKLRQFGERLAQLTAAKMGWFESEQESQADLLRRLRLERVLSPEVSDLFHQIRRGGNKAAHQQTDDHAEALALLKMARQLGIWFYRIFGANATFQAGAFVPPPNPVDATAELTDELRRLRIALRATRSEVEEARLAAEEQARAALSATEKARQEAEDRSIWEKLAQDSEQSRSELQAQLVALQSEAKRLSPQQTAAIIAQADQAAAAIDLDEDATRIIIDQQLREAGWEADSQSLRYSKGVRPTKGKNMAIAEWSTANGIADYALFIGTSCVGFVEAKRKRKNVSAAIDQAERYAMGFQAGNGFDTVGGSPWGEFQVPFVFATNGRSYLKQIETESGIWFRDVRQATNHRRALTGWLTPEGLEAQLKMDRQVAHASLKTQSFQFGFPIRPYQQRAIEAVETLTA